MGINLLKGAAEATDLLYLKEAKIHIDFSCRGGRKPCGVCFIFPKKKNAYIVTIMGIINDNWLNYPHRAT